MTLLIRKLSCLNVHLHSYNYLLQVIRSYTTNRSVTLSVRCKVDL